MVLLSDTDEAVTVVLTAEVFANVSVVFVDVTDEVSVVSSSEMYTSESRSSGSSLSSVMRHMPVPAITAAQIPETA